LALGTCSAVAAAVTPIPTQFDRVGVEGFPTQFARQCVVIGERGRCRKCATGNKVLRDGKRVGAPYWKRLRIEERPVVEFATQANTAGA
jgi:hypothetical protein